MKKLTIFLCVITLVFGVVGIATAAVINFDDITTPSPGFSQIMGSYQNLNWSDGPVVLDAIHNIQYWSFYAISNEWYGIGPPWGLGYFGNTQHSLASNVAQNAPGYHIAVTREDYRFDFIGASFSPALFEDARGPLSASSVKITGWEYSPGYDNPEGDWADNWKRGDDVTIDLSTIDIANSNTLTWYGVDLKGYNGYWFESEGYFLMDDFTYEVSAVPEPATMLLLGSGLIGLAGFARRRFKK